LGPRRIPIRTASQGVQALVVMFAIACGACTSGDDQLFERQSPACGPGTGLENGECVPAIDASSEQDASADAGLDQPESGALDAPAEAGPDTGGDTYNADAHETDVADSAVADTPDETMTDAAPDVDDAGLLPSDETCLSEYWVNCSELGVGPQCEPAMLNCSETTCGTDGFTLADSQMLPFQIRLPSHPKPDPACKDFCSVGTTVFSVKVGLYVIAPAFRVRVGGPWVISVTDLDLGEGSGYCLGSDAVVYSECAIVEPGQIVDIATTQSDAPARNVTIESVPAGTTCP